MADRGISTSLGPFAEMSKPGRVHSSRRTRASASLKVGSGFGYQAAARHVIAWPGRSSCNRMVNGEPARVSAGWGRWRMGS